MAANVTLPGTGSVVETIDITGVERQVVAIGDGAGGTSKVAIKAASTAPAATDPALVVAISPNSVNANGQTTMSVSAPVVIASDQSPVKTLSAPTATANGCTSTRINSAASTNLAFIKASPGQAYEIDLFNNAAYTVFVKLYNKTSAPVLASDTPIWTIPIQSGGGFSKSFTRGKAFATGIAYAITKLQADTDATAVAAGDVTGSIDWI